VRSSCAKAGSTGTIPPPAASASRVPPNQEVYLTFSPRFERIWLESKRRLPEYVAPPTLLVAVDHRPTISLNGDWHTIVDPYGTGLYTFHGKLRTEPASNARGA
jgi:hypothetical protein